MTSQDFLRYCCICQQSFLITGKTIHLKTGEVICETCYEDPSPRLFVIRRDVSKKTEELFSKPKRLTLLEKDQQND